MEPRFRRRADGSLNLTDTVEAAKVKEANKGKPYTRPLSPEGVLDKAKKSLSQHHGDLANRKHLLGSLKSSLVYFADKHSGGWLKMPWGMLLTWWHL